MRTKDNEKLSNIVEFIDNYYEAKRETPTIDKIANSLNMNRATVQRYLVELDKIGSIKYYGRQGIETEKIAKMKGGNINVALIGSIACGEPVFAEANIEEYFSLPESLVGKGMFFLLRAKGNSMVNVGISQGDLVLIRQQNVASPGEIVVALCDESDATLKRYYPEKNHVRLHPENDDMDDIYVKKCIIQGVAIKVLKNL